MTHTARNDIPSSAETRDSVSDDVARHGSVEGSQHPILIGNGIREPEVVRISSFFDLPATDEPFPPFLPPPFEIPPGPELGAVPHRPVSGARTRTDAFLSGHPDSGQSALRQPAATQGRLQLGGSQPGNRKYERGRRHEDLSAHATCPHTNGLETILPGRNFSEENTNISIDEVLKRHRAVEGICGKTAKSNPGIWDAIRRDESSRSVETVQPSGALPDDTAPANAEATVSRAASHAVPRVLKFKGNPSVAAPFSQSIRIGKNVLFNEENPRNIDSAVRADRKSTSPDQKISARNQPAFPSRSAAQPGISQAPPTLLEFDMAKPAATFSSDGSRHTASGKSDDSSLRIIVPMRTEAVPADSTVSTCDSSLPVIVERPVEPGVESGCPEQEGDSGPLFGKNVLPENAPVHAQPIHVKQTSTPESQVIESALESCAPESTEPAKTENNAVESNVVENNAIETAVPELSPTYPVFHSLSADWPELCRKLHRQAAAQFRGLSQLLISESQHTGEAVSPGGDGVFDATGSSGEVGGRIVAFCGCTAGAGTSTLLLGTGRELARLGKRTLLIDLNLDNPELIETFDFVADQGWEEMFTPEGLEQYDGVPPLLRMEPDGFFLMPLAREKREEAIRFLDTYDISDVIAYFLEWFDHILIDGGTFEGHPLVRRIDSLNRFGADSILLIQSTKTASARDYYAEIEKLPGPHPRMLGIAENHA